MVLDYRFDVHNTTISARGSNFRLLPFSLDLSEYSY